MSARDLLELFRSAGVLRPLDLHLARTLGRIAGRRAAALVAGAA